MNTVKYLLMPGRHHSVTQFQTEYLKYLQNIHPGAVVVWAVTSADHGGTQRNPISGIRRLGMLEYVAASDQLSSEVYLIPNRGFKQDFAHYVIEEIRTQTGGRLALTPHNTLVVCSTQAVTDQYEALGFMIDGAERGTDETLPWDIVEAIINNDEGWRESKPAKSMHPSAAAYYQRYGLAEFIQEIFADPLVSGDDGDITDTRDYATYRQAFEENAWRKVNDIAPYVNPGKILDVGCATGQTLKLLSEKPELFESDFYGVEAARPLYEICQQRKTNGEFGQANMFFYQRNIMQAKLFEPDSMDTVITMALTHEIESYMGRGELKKFIRRAYEMCAPGGVYINYDVVGPDDPDREVYVRFNQKDGDNPDDLCWDLQGQELGEFLRGLSTSSRFKRFVVDFRHDEGDGINVGTKTIDGKDYCVMRHGDLCDFLAKKDYTDSWKSEMHERFCFYSHADWCRELESAGFTLAEGTRAIQNQWLIENRFEPAASVWCMQDSLLVPVDQPVTNTLLICKKPIVA